MDEPRSATPEGCLERDPRLACLPGSSWGDLSWLALLLLIALGLRAWQLTHSGIASRDCIGYVRMAWNLGHEPWARVVAAGPRQPGYPVAILAMSRVLGPCLPHDPAYAMQLSAQLVSALAGILLVIPVFYLGKDLLGRRVGFWTALLFQCLPTSGILMADGLSEPLFFLLAGSALVCAGRALRTGGAVWFAGTGLLGALAFLTRAEGGLVPAVAGLV